MERQAVVAVALVALIATFASFRSGQSPAPLGGTVANSDGAVRPAATTAVDRSPVVTVATATPKDVAWVTPRRVVVFLKSRDYTLTVYTGQRFTVTSNDGRVLAAEISVQELRETYPLLYHYYRWSYAEAWAGMR